MKQLLVLALIILISACDNPAPQKGLPKNWDTSSKKLVVFDLNQYAWAAYNEQGNKIKTGRASGGKSYCPDVKRSCRTVTGTFQVIVKKGADCQSKKYPIVNDDHAAGGAKMPYCMYFYNGYAIHGAHNVTQTHVSHGCIHVPTNDAKWLNHQFVELGTKIVVLPYSD